MRRVWPSARKAPKPRSIAQPDFLGSESFTTYPFLLGLISFSVTGRSLRSLTSAAATESAATGSPTPESATAVPARAHASPAATAIGLRGPATGTARVAAHAAESV